MVGHRGGLGGVAPSLVGAWHSWHSCHHVMISVAQPYGGSLSSTEYSTFVKTLLITSKARELKGFMLVSFKLIGYRFWQ